MGGKSGAEERKGKAFYEGGKEQVDQESFKRETILRFHASEEALKGDKERGTSQRCREIPRKIQQLLYHSG